MADTQPILATDEAGALATTSRAVAGSPLQCLVVSHDGWRLERLAECARNGGWYAIVCDDTATAAASAAHTVIRLAILDLECVSELTTQPLSQLTQRLAEHKELLLIVCGPESSTSVELWARQLGVWLYLAGAELGPDFTAICGEAFQIVQRLATQSQGHAAQSSPAHVTHR